MQFDELLNRICNGNISIAINVWLQMTDSVLKMLKSPTETKFSETTSTIKDYLYKSLIDEKNKQQKTPNPLIHSNYYENQGVDRHTTMTSSQAKPYLSFSNSKSPREYVREEKSYSVKKKYTSPRFHPYRPNPREEHRSFSRPASNNETKYSRRRSRNRNYNTFQAQTVGSYRSKIMQANPWIPPLPFYATNNDPVKREFDNRFRDQCWVGLWLNESPFQIEGRIGSYWSKYLQELVFHFQAIKAKKEEIISYVLRGDSQNDIITKLGPKWVELIDFIYRSCKEEIEAEQTRNIMMRLSQGWTPKQFLRNFGDRWEHLVFNIWNNRRREIEKARTELIVQLITNGKDIDSIIKENGFDAQTMSEIMKYHGPYIQYKVEQNKRMKSECNTVTDDLQVQFGRNQPRFHENENNRLRIQDEKCVGITDHHKVREPIHTGSRNEDFDEEEIHGNQICTL